MGMRFTRLLRALGAERRDRGLRGGRGNAYSPAVEDTHMGKKTESGRPGPWNAEAALEPIQQALLAAMPDANFDIDPGPASAALSFVHPAHEATVLVVVDDADPHHKIPTLLLGVILGDWADVREQPGGAESFGLNALLMTCAVGLLPLNQDEVALALTKRLPLTAVQPGDVLGVIDDMIWEYAAMSGWLDGGKQKEPPPPSDLQPARPRLIGSLDEV